MQIDTSKHKLILIFLGILVGTLVVGFFIFEGDFLNKKIVQNRDGLFKTVNAKGLNIEWKESLISFKNENNSFELKLPLRKIDWKREGDKISTDYGPYTFSYKLIKNKDKVTGVKEEIIIREKYGAKSVFEFPVNLKDLNPKKINGIWRFYNKKGEEAFYIPKAFMIDNDGKKSFDIELSFANLNDNNYKNDKLLVKPNQDWLKKAAYPVVIDPTIQVPEKGRGINKQKLTRIDSDTFAFATEDGSVVEVGTETHSPPQPYLKLNKWNSEAEFKLDIPYNTNQQPKLVQNNKLRYNSSENNIAVDFYTKERREYKEKINGKEKTFIQNQNGGVEFDTILKEKPEENTLSFPIETKNLEFYYQEPLHPDHPTWADTNGDGKADSFRPENVVGSYAVYHSSKKHNNYKTGKAFHIYRPKIIDNKGDETWGKLNINEEKGILSIEIDESWLNKASYPVVVDPIFGYSEAGGTSDEFLMRSPSFAGCVLQFDYQVGTQWSAPETGILSQVNAYTSGDNAVDIKLGIYTEDGDGTDSHSLEENNQKDNASASASWNDITGYSSSLVGGTNYIMSIIGNGEDLDCHQSYFVYYDSVGNQRYYDDDNFPDFSFSDSWNEEEAGTGRNYSIYATYYNKSGSEYTFNDLRSSAFEKGGSLPTSSTDYTNEATSSDYVKLENSDNNRWQTDLATTTDGYNSQIYNFTIDEPTSTVASIDIEWEGHGTSSSNTIYLKAYNYQNSTWTDVTSLTSATTADQTLEGAVSGNIEDYLDSSSTFTVMAEVKTETFSCGDDDVTFTYNGSGVTYGTVATSGECWMDRNLGASQVATSYDDSNSYGDLFQWGRPDDGHQERNSSETSTLASSDHPGHSDFITPGSSPYDWRNPQNDSMWNEDGSGSNNGETCPEGWRVPSESEWSSVSSNWSDRSDAFNSVLKLPSAGYRSSNGGIGDSGSDGYYWSSSVDSTNCRSLNFASDALGLGSAARAFGHSIRCLRDSGGASTPTPLNTDYIKIKTNPQAFDLTNLNLNNVAFEDYEPPYCSTESDKNTTTTIDGDIVYCDSDLRTWTPTFDLPADSNSATQYVWSNDCYGATTSCNSYTDGESNTTCIINNCNDGGSNAAEQCNNLTYAGYSDWYLPARSELNDESGNGLYHDCLDDQGKSNGDSCIPTWDSNGYADIYWSSSESYADPSDAAYFLYFDDGYVFNGTKDGSGYVRCARRQ